MTSRAGEIKAKLEPRYAGDFPFVTKIKISVPTPFISNAMAGLIPSKYGTSTDALNMAKVCWMLRGMPRFRGTLSSTCIILESFINPPFFNRFSQYFYTRRYYTHCADVLQRLFHRIVRKSQTFFHAAVSGDGVWENTAGVFNLSFRICQRWTVMSEPELSGPA